MTTREWLKSYPKGVPADIDPDHYRSIVDVFQTACNKFKQKPCFTNMDVTLTFEDVQRLSGQFSAFLRKDLGLVKGDRIGIQMPNALQYPVVLFGALRAGLVVVNTNPLYTPREMEHQYKDSGVKAIVVLSNFARNVQEVLPKLAASIGEPDVIVTDLGDLFPTAKRMLVNAAVRHIKKMVPAYELPKAIDFRDALARGSRHGQLDDVALVGEDLAFLQYTGGTTGVAKGAMLTHRNIVANMEQSSAWMAPRFTEGEDVVITPLPLSHIFSLTVNCLLFMKWGASNILITNPRDIPAFIKLLQKQPFSIMTAVNTLLTALMNHKDFESIDFSRTKLTVAGAMALQRQVAERWRERTKTTIIEGYGLTEASPVVCCNPVDGTDRVGTIGLPFPSTTVRFMAEDGSEVAPGQPGELIAQGPQVMKGYWNQPDETAHALRDGWLWTGDIAQLEEGGFVRIVDRKKDMILVSGFNVYPNEIEEVVAQMPGVAEVGAIGVPDDRSGEAVKVVIVKRDPNLQSKQVIEHCQAHLTGYKVPRHVEFRDELPKTNVGKILRRALR